MDFKSMKRRELQALCKKYGIKANSTNLQMAESLTALLESQEEKRGKDVEKKVSFCDQLENFGSTSYKYLDEMGSPGRRRTRRGRSIAVLENENITEVGETKHDLRSRASITYGAPVRRSTRKLAAEAEAAHSPLLIVEDSEDESNCKESVKDDFVEEARVRSPTWKEDFSKQKELKKKSVCEIDYEGSDESVVDNQNIAEEKFQNEPLARSLRSRAVVVLEDKGLAGIPKRKRSQRTKNGSEREAAEQIVESVEDETALVDTKTRNAKSAEISEQQDGQLRRSTRIASSRVPIPPDELKSVPKRVGRKKRPNTRESHFDYCGEPEIMQEEPKVDIIVSFDEDGDMGGVANTSDDNLNSFSTDSVSGGEVFQGSSSLRSSPPWHKNIGQAVMSDESSREPSASNQLDEMHAMNCSVGMMVRKFRDVKDQGLEEDGMGEKLLCLSESDGLLFVENQVNDQTHDVQSPKFGYDVPLEGSPMDGLCDFLCQVGYDSCRKVTVPCDSTIDGELHEDSRNSFLPPEVNEESLRQNDVKYLQEVAGQAPDQEQMADMNASDMSHYDIFSDKFISAPVGLTGPTGLFLPCTCNEESPLTGSGTPSQVNCSLQAVDNNDSNIRVMSCTFQDYSGAHFEESPSLHELCSARSSCEVHEAFKLPEKYERNEDQLADNCDTQYDPSSDEVAHPVVNTLNDSGGDGVRKQGCSHLSGNILVKARISPSCNNIQADFALDNEVENHGDELSPVDTRKSLSTATSSCCCTKERFNTSLESQTDLCVDSADSFVGYESCIEDKPSECRESLSPIFGPTSVDQKAQKHASTKILLQNSQLFRVVSTNQFILRSIPVENRAAVAIKRSSSCQAIRAGNDKESFPRHSEDTEECNEHTFSFMNAKFSPDESKSQHEFASYSESGNLSLNEQVATVLPETASSEVQISPNESVRFHRSERGIMITVQNPDAPELLEGNDPAYALPHGWSSDSSPKSLTFEKPTVTSQQKLDSITLQLVDNIISSPIHKQQVCKEYGRPESCSRAFSIYEVSQEESPSCLSSTLKESPLHNSNIQDLGESCPAALKKSSFSSMISRKSHSSSEDKFKEIPENNNVKFSDELYTTDLKEDFSRVPRTSSVDHTIEEQMAKAIVLQSDRSLHRSASPLQFNLQTIPAGNRVLGILKRYLSCQSARVGNGEKLSPRETKHKKRVRGHALSGFAEPGVTLSANTSTLPVLPEPTNNEVTCNVHNMGTTADEKKDSPEACESGDLLRIDDVQPVDANFLETSGAKAEEIMITSEEELIESIGSPDEGKSVRDGKLAQTSEGDSENSTRIYINQALSISDEVLTVTSKDNACEAVATGCESVASSFSIVMVSKVPEIDNVGAVACGDFGRSDGDVQSTKVVCRDAFQSQDQEGAECMNKSNLRILERSSLICTFNSLNASSSAAEIQGPGGTNSEDGSILSDEMDELSGILANFRISSIKNKDRVRNYRTPIKLLNRSTLLEMEDKDKENTPVHKLERSCKHNLAKPLAASSARKPLQAVDKTNKV